jgi:hypothetical protein
MRRPGRNLIINPSDWEYSEPPELQSLFQGLPKAPWEPATKITWCISTNISTNNNSNIPQVSVLYNLK